VQREHPGSLLEQQQIQALQAQLRAIQAKLEETFRCPINKQIMVEPVIASDGKTYEKETIERCIKTTGTSPFTRAILMKDLICNQDKKSEIEEYLASHPEAYDNGEVYLPESWKKELIALVESNQISKVNELLDKDRRLLFIDLGEGHTVFHIAGQSGSWQLTDNIFNRLISNGLDKQLNIAKPNNFNPLYLNTLLQLSLKKKDFPKCDLLLRLGASVEQPNAEHNNLLHGMVVTDNIEAVNWVLNNGGNLESLNIQNNTPLLLAVLNNNEELTKILLYRGANKKIKNLQQETPILIALLNNNIKILSLLVGEKLASIPALHLAIELEDNNLLQLILAKIPVDLETRDLQQRSPLYLAVEKQNLEAAAFLIQHNALVNTIAIDGTTPLHIAANIGNKNIIILLLKSGAQHKIRNSDDKTPIDVARQGNNIQIAQLIEQTAREIKQQKSEEMRRAIESLNERIVKLELEQSSVKPLAANVDELKRKIEIIEKVHTTVVGQQGQSSPVILFSTTAQPASPLHPYIIIPKTSQELTKFLRHVGFGEQNEAESMLKSNPNLATLQRGLTDCADRYFKNITGFQYAIWALDYHMWTMIKKYLNIENMRAQVAELNTGSWIRTHGSQINLSPLIEALDVYVKNYENWDRTKRKNHWCQQGPVLDNARPAAILKSNLA